MTKSQIDGINFIKMLAKNASDDLGRNAANGSKARPTVKQINRALDRLASIIESANAVLIGETQ